MVEKSKIMSLLETFTPKEMERFHDFVASPYFNKNKKLTNLLKLLLEAKNKPQLEPRQSKALVYERLFPGASYDDKQFRYLTSDLLQLAEQFLALRNYEQDPLRSDIDLLQCYVERKLEKPYTQVLQKVQSRLGKTTHHDADFFYHQLSLSEVEEQRFGGKFERRFNATVQHASNYLDCFYFTKQLKYTCEMLDRQSLLQGEYHPNLSGWLLKHLKQQEFYGQNIIKLYYMVLTTLLQEDKEANFQELKSSILSHPDTIAPSVMREFYLYGINYCARKIRKGKENYVTEALDLYMDGINNGTLYEKNHLSPWTFTNVVKLALRLKRYSWIETFIRQYAPSLPAEFRENALHYNLAELYFYTRQFDLALQHLHKVKLSDLNFHLGARVILAKVYYETGEQEALLSLLASFSIFLKRNKEISQQLKKTYLNFCDLLFQIVKRNPKKMAALQEKIKTTALLTDRAWLMGIL